MPEVERQNRVIKEGAGATVQSLPYTKMPKKMRAAVINYVIYWLNCIPKEGQDNAPREMILGGSKVDYHKMCKLLFGAYVQVHNDHQVTNTMEPRTTGNLTTGSIIIRCRWAELPILTEIILRLEELSYDPEDKIANILDQDIENDEDEDEEIRFPEQTEQTIEDENDVDSEYEDMPTLRELEIEERIVIPNVSSEDVSYETDEERFENPVENTLDVSAKAETVVVSNHGHGYNLRPKQTRYYSHRFSFLSVAAGIKKWGDKTKKAVQDELKMLMDEKVFYG